MSVEFHPDKHEYKSVDIIEGIDWVSATSLISQFKPPFFPEAQALKSSKSKSSKWYKIPVEEILAAWGYESQRSLTLGTWFHEGQEAELLSQETIDIDGIRVPVVHPIEDDNGVKIAPEQKLEDGVYPEHFVYLKTAGACGQVDRVDVVNGVVSLTDYKTYKELKREGFANWEGVTKKLLPPLAHIDDCNLMHTALQLSLYMFIIMKHNPNLIPGKLILSHIIFEVESYDKYDNPITKLDEQGNPIVKAIEKHEVPYMKREAELMVNWLKENRHNLRKKV